MMEICLSLLLTTTHIGSQWWKIIYTVRISMSLYHAMWSRERRLTKNVSFWIEKSLLWFKNILIEVCLSMCRRTLMLMSYGLSLNLWFKRKLIEIKPILLEDWCIWNTRMVNHNYCIREIFFSHWRRQLPIMVIVHRL